MNILLVDDEVPARDRLRRLVEQVGGDYRVVGEAANGAEALQQCETLSVDLVLMDIRMPGMDGLEAADRLAQQAVPPAVIFVTAYDEHALAAFERSAVDYLLKPIRQERLQAALDRVATLNRPQLESLNQRQKTSKTHFLSVSYRGGLERIALAEVIFFHAEQKYVTVRHTEGEALVEASLRSLEQQHGGDFLRIHRNALVAKARLSGLRRKRNGTCHVALEGTKIELEVSRRHLAEVRRLLRGQDGSGSN